MAKGIPYGRRLLPQLVDQIAEASPEKAFAEVAHVDWRRDGWGKVTYGQVARAVDALSWWLDETFEQKVPFETFVYSGPSDLRYALIPLAAMKTRRTVSDTLFFVFGMVTSQTSPWHHSSASIVLLTPLSWECNRISSLLTLT